MKDDSNAPRWGVWLQLPAVKLWQAVALSIDREPTEPLLKAVFNGRVTDSKAPPHVLELLKRWRYCEQALSFDGPIKPQGYGLANPPVCPVLLADVAVFLAAAGFKLPEKLRALGSVPTMQEAQAAAPVSAEPVRPAAVPAPTAAAPVEAAAAMQTRVSQAAEKEAREDARLAHCEAVGLVFDKDPLRPLPYGIASAAASLDPPITRQSISTDVKAALRRRFEGNRNGRG